MFGPLVKKFDDIYNHYETIPESDRQIQSWKECCVITKAHVHYTDTRKKIDSNNKCHQFKTFTTFAFCELSMVWYTRV